MGGMRGVGQLFAYAGRTRGETVAEDRQSEPFRHPAFVRHRRGARPRAEKRRDGIPLPAGDGLRLGPGSSWKPWGAPPPRRSHCRRPALDVRAASLRGARPALGARGRDLRRIPGADRRAGRRDDPRAAGAKPCPTTDAILACAKHYIAYAESIGGRDSVDTPITLRKIRETFLPPFKKAVEAGCATVHDGLPAPWTACR